MMNRGRTIFSQLLDLTNRHEFDKCVERYSKEITPRKFSYWDQYLSMAFAQITFRESLRDIEVCLKALGTQTYHMGFRTRVTRSTLSYANNTRDWRIWSDFAQTLIAKARKLYAGDPLEVEFKNAAYAVDSSTIMLCLTLCPWANYTTTGKAIKLHTQLDLRGKIPSFIHISQAKMPDVKFLDKIILEAGAMYIFDRGYFDFARFHRFTTQGAFFVTRIKSNVFYKRTKIFSRDRYATVRMDAAICPLSKKARKNYPDRLRLIEYRDPSSKKVLVFITNNFVLSAQTIADLYRNRWHVELFFKWIKQHLRIKSFFGTSENAVKTQIWIAISVYTLVAILKKQLQLPHSLHSILQVLSICSSDKTYILQPFRDSDTPNSNTASHNQLNLFDIPIGQ